MLFSTAYFDLKFCTRGIFGSLITNLRFYFYNFQIQDGGSNMADQICEIQSNFTKIGIQGFLGMLMTNMSLAWIRHLENRKSNLGLVISNTETPCKLKVVEFGEFYTCSPPSWIRHFEFCKYNLGFVIYEPDNPRVQIFRPKYAVK